MSALNIEQLIAKANNQIAQAESVNKSARSAHVEKEWTPSRWCKRHHRGLPRMRAPRPRRRATHRRLSHREVRQALEEDQFDDAVASQIEEHLDRPARAVVVCACGKLTSFTKADEAHSKWREHVREHAHYVPKAKRFFVPFVDKCKTERRRLIKSMRRQQRLVESKGLLAQLRHTMNGQIPAMQMANFFRVTNHTTWDNSTAADWSAASGGAGGVGVPGAGDTAIFDANTPVVTITTNYDPSITTITLDTGFTGTLTLGAACTLTGAFTLTQGTFTTGNQSCSFLTFSSSNALVRTLTTGSSAIAITGGSATVWSTATVTNLTVTANTATITCSGATATANAGTQNMNGASLILSGSGTASYNGSTSTWANVTRTGTATKTDSLSTSATSFTVTGTFTVNGNSAVNRVLVLSNTFGTARTINAAVISVTNVDFVDITAAGAGNWNLSAITGSSGDVGGNTGITFTASATQTWSGTSGGNWSANAWTSRVPLPQDDVVINAAFIATQTVTADMPRLGRNIDWTGVTGSVKWTTGLSGGSNSVFYGSVTLAAGMSLIAGSSSWGFAGRASQTMTMAGQTWTNSFNIVGGVGGTLTLQDAALFGASLVVSNSTFAANNQTVACDNFNSSGSALRAVSMGSGAWSLTRSSATPTTLWNTGTTTNLTLTVSTCVVSVTAAPGSVTTDTVITGGVTMPNFTVNGGANLTVQFSDAFTTAGTITLTAAKLDTNNQTVNGFTLNFGNTSTRTLTLGSSAITLTSIITNSSWTGLTVTSNTAVITMTGASATVVSLTANTSNFNGTSFVIATATVATNQTLNFNGLTIANLTLTGPASKFNNVAFTSAVIVTGTFTVTGNSSTNRLLVNSSTLGTARTITVNTTVTVSNADFQDITAAGTASWNISAATGGSGDALGNTGITFTAAAPQFWFSGTGNWSDSTKWFLATAGGGGAGRVPLPQDNVVLDASSGSGTITADMPRQGATQTYTGYTGTLTLSADQSVYGSFTFASGMTVGSPNFVWNFYGRSSLTITCNGKSFPGQAVVNAVGGTYTVQDAFVTVNRFVVTNGTFAANNQTITARDLFSNNSNTRTITMGSGAWSLTMPTGASSAWNTATTTGLTLTVNTAVVSCTGAPGSAATVTVTTGSVSMPSFTVNGGANLTVQFSDAFTTTGTMSLTQAKLDTNGQTCNWLTFNSSNSNTRTLTMGSSAITVTNGGNSWSTAAATNLTITASTSVITLNGANVSFITGTPTAGSYNSVVESGSGNALVNSGAVIANLTRTGTAVKTDTLAFSQAMTVSTTFTITGNSTINRVLVQSNTLGSTRTITCNGVCAHTNVDWQDITAAGTGAPFTGTSMGDALGNTNITFDAPVTRYGVVAGNWSSTATWSNASGGAGGFSVPLPQDTVILDASSGAGTYTADMPRIGANQTYTGFTRTLSLSITITSYGSMTLGSGMTFSGSGTHILAGRSSLAVTSNGKSWPSSLSITSVGGTYTLQDALNAVSQLTVNYGSFTANNLAASVSAFNSSNTNVRTVVMGTGAWSLNRTSSTAVWDTTLVTGLTLTVTGNTTSFTGTSGTNTITTGSVTMPNVTFNGAGGTWQFQDAFTTAGTITLTSGTLDTNSKSVTASQVVISGSTARTITMGSTAWTLSILGTGWSVSIVTNLTVTANTSTATLTGNSSSQSDNFISGAVNWNGLSVVMTMAGSGKINGTPGFTIANLTRTGTALKTDLLSIACDFTVTGQASFNGNSVTNRLLVQSSTLGTPRTITVSGTRAHSNVDFMDITGAGSASLDLSAISGGSGDCGGNSGYTFTPAQTNYYKAAGTDNFSTTAKWFLATNGAGGAGRVPLPQDTAVFDSFSGAFTYSQDMPRMSTITMIGWTGTLNFNTGANLFGNFTVGSGSSITGMSTQIFSGRGSQTITSNGQTWTPAITINAFGGTYTLQDAMTNSRSTGSVVTVTTGTFATGNQTVTLTGAQGAMNINGGTLTMGSSAFSMGSTTAGSFWTYGSGTVTANTATITLTNATSNSRTFAGGGKSYGTLSYTVAASTGALVISGANTFANLTVTSEAGNAKTLTLPSATNTTVTGTLSLNGVASAHLILNASTPGSQATITAGAGVAIDVNFVDIQDSNAVGGARFQDHDGVSTGNTAGWLFVTVVSDTLTLRWHNTIPASDTVALVWAVRRLATDTVQVVWGTRAPASDVTNLRWNTRFAASDVISLRWNTRLVVTDAVTLRWHVTIRASDVLTLRWRTYLKAGDAVSIVWRTRAPAADTVVLKWGTLQGLPFPKAKATTRLIGTVSSEDE